ncbi:MAG: class I SAM-dependent methyltransferase [Acidobacteria bacterium]|nr:class I SAM-dependent methyltransferase [Acidobacteriota bacterium]
MPPAPCTVIDVGGGPGVYSLWLARAGYEVHLVELAPDHVEQARAASSTQEDYSVASIQAGDTRELPQLDGSIDAVLLMGPLYHLTERSERLAALREAHRVLRPGGVIVAAAISRCASLMAGLTEGHIDDPEFVSILERDLHEGQHRNLPHNLSYFTTAFFHRPEELLDEVQDAGFGTVSILPVEGPGWLAKDFEERWANPSRRKQLLDLVRRTEKESSLLMVSPHLLAIAERS